MTELRCSQCGNKARLARQPNRTLVVTCECDLVGVRVDRVLPEGWT